MQILNIIYCTDEQRNYTANQHLLIFGAQTSGAGWKGGRVEGWKGGRVGEWMLERV